jgi:glycosyltransferase involved in cell wall biosynthesis
MKLLIVAQVLDTEDPVLGFFVRWVEEFSKRVEHLEVICLRKGAYTLPANVRVHSLGKENKPPHFVRRFLYTFRFIVLAWRLRHEYDAVFVHMNQEYILIAGWLWKLLGKRVYLWRNHYAGSWLTDVAAVFCTNIFCTSKHSYTVKYKKTILMPVGVDTDRFMLGAHTNRKPHSILFLGRIAPSKRPDMFLDALAILVKENVEFSASLVGSPGPQDHSYYERLKEKVHSSGLDDRVSFYPGPPNAQTPEIYRSHEIFVNASPSGMLDKTIFEAAASGCMVLAASADFSELAGSESHFESSSELANHLKSLLTHPRTAPPGSLTQAQSLTALMAKLLTTIR